MAKQSKVTNTLGETYSQTVNGIKYDIKPNESIILNRYEAVNLVGHYCGQTRVGLKIEHLPDSGEVKKPDVKQVFVAPDGKEFSSKQELMEHMKKGR